MGGGDTDGGDGSGGDKDVGGDIEEKRANHLI